MELKIKTLTLTNFRGVREFSLVDLGKETNVHGKNGSGKTSLYDAFTWLLFGKDHEGRSDYELKARNEMGEQTPRAKVSVSAELLADGKPLKLERVYREKWVKARGESEETFSGHTTDYRINDVEVQMSAYNDRVKELCDETVFKSVTNPHYFTSLAKDEQRNILFSLIPDVTNEQVAATNSEFEAILNEITGSSIEEAKKQIAAKKRPLKEAIDKLPVEIETTLNNMPEVENWEELESELKLKEAEINDIELQLSDISKRSQAKNNEVLGIQEEINKLEADNRKLERVEREMIEEDIERKSNDVRKMLLEVGELERDYTTKKARIDSLSSDKKYYLKKLEDLRAEWKKISAEKPEFDDNQFICPTCKRVFDDEDVEAKKEELISNFNKEKSRRLDENIQQGKKISVQLKAIEEEVSRINLPEKADTSEKTAEIERMRVEIETLKKKESTFRSQPAFIANTAKIAELREAIRLVRESAGVNDEGIISRKREIVAQVDSLKKRLFNKSVIERLKKQVKEMEDRKRATNQELAALEQKEFLIKEFEYAKNAEYEQRINMLFESVQFRLFKQQVNGQVIPDCEAMMHGTLYSTLSNAEKIYAGLDIIRTISSHYNIVAPIFIDNRESTTEIPKMDAQIINLFVNPEYEQLTIK